jgi:2'-5' RNA ligase
VTLARCREPADVSGLVAELSGYAGAPWTATEIHLIRSTPGGVGAAPHYETVSRWPLHPPAS